MATSGARYLCSCGSAALISHLSTRSCYCRSAATYTVRPRSRSCLPPTSSATFRASDFERWLSTTGPSRGQSKSSLRAWAQYLSRFSPHVDVSSMSRVLTSLHVDLPRNLPEISRLFPAVSLAQLQQIFLKINRNRHDRAPSGSDRQSYLGSKQATDDISAEKQFSSTAAKSTAVTDSAQLHYEEQLVSSNMSTSSDGEEETGTRTASMQPHDVQGSASSPADKAHVQPSASSATVTDSVVTKFNTVASGVARQFAEYMPTVEINTTAQTKPPTHPQQKQESCEVDDKKKTKSREVPKETSAAEKQTTVRRQLVTRGSIDRQTRGLVLCLRGARTSTSQLVRLEELCQHIAQYPDCTGIAVKVCSSAAFSYGFLLIYNFCI